MKVQEDPTIATLSHDEVCALHRRYGASIYAFAVSRVSDADAKDLVQEVFLNVIRHKDWPTDEIHQRKLLFTILKRRIADLGRRGGRTPRGDPESGDTPDAEAPDPDRRLAERTTVINALHDVSARNEQWGEALRLRVLADLSDEEVALQLEAPVNTVRGWINKAIGFLRDRAAHPRPPEAP